MAVPASDSPPQLAALPFSDTVRKVDRAVARLEELQCMVRASRSNATYAKYSSTNGRSRLSLHAGDRFPNKNISNEARKNAQHARSGKPALLITCGDREQGQQHAQYVCSSKSNALPVAISCRSARVVDFPPLPPHKHVISSTAVTPKDFPSRMISPSSMPLSSPPSSACSSSVHVVTRRARLIKNIAPSKLPRTSSANVKSADPNATSLKRPRTFFVHAGQANPNRPWCLSSSPSPTITSSTTSNYIYSPSSNSSVPLPTKSPSRFSPLHRKISGKCHETLQMEPLLCKSPECVRKPIKASPNCHRKIPWFSQTRLSLPSLTPPSPSTKRCARRFSLTSKRCQESPPRPLPALITRLPARRKKASSPDKKPVASPKRRTQTSRGSTPNASSQEVQTTIGRDPSIAQFQSPSEQLMSKPILPLPLPPALQARPSSTQHIPMPLSSCKMKMSHKRSSSCPRQCRLPLADCATNVNLCNIPSSPPPANLTKTACFQSTGKENCFSGCGPAAWPCMRRSWSFGHRHSLENSDSTGSDPYILRHVNGYTQNGKKMNSRSSQVYKADSFMQEPNRDQRKLYIG